jgi:hypothetical protein
MRRPIFPFLAILVLSCPAFAQEGDPHADVIPRDGLVLWLDAADVETADGKVTQWPDKSGQGNLVSEADAALQPQKVMVDDRPAVRFSKSRLGRASLNGFLSGEQPFQLFVVMQAAQQESGSPRVLDFSSASQGDMYSHKRKGFWFGYEDYAADPDSKGRARIAVLFGAEGVSATNSWDGRRHVLEAAYAGNQRWALYHDGAAVDHGRYRGDVGFLGFQGGSRLTIGHQFQKGTDEHYFRGDLFEILVFNRVLRAKEQHAVGDYLTRKYQLGSSYQRSEPAEVLFEEHIVPLLARRCHDCHGKEDPEGGLNLTDLVGLYRGGTSGPVLTPGNAQKSFLLHIVASKEMPPREAGDPLLDSEVELIRRWIDGGAKATEKVDLASLASENRSDHWSFQRLGRPEVPAIQAVDAARNAIDQFIVQQLEASGLSLSSTADRATLIRRASLDLTGLLPSPQQLDAFIQDDSPGAWENLLDRLLASEHFGERWGRHWLDSVGHTDTNALDNDQVIVSPAKGKWRYRDYVVRRFNEDRPFEDFLVEQLAGDELVDWRNATHFDDSIRQKLIATGMMRSSPDSTDQGELNIFSIRYFVLHQTAESLSQNLLGLTMQCCKCHDHKFESISQRDYYRFTAFIMPAFTPRDWLTPPQRELRLRGAQEQVEFVKQQQAATSELAAIREAGRSILYDRTVAAIPEQVRADLLAAQVIPKEKRNEVQKYLTEKLGEKFEFNRDQIITALTAEQKQREVALVGILAELEQRDQQEWVQAVYDVGSVRSTFVLRRGEFEMPGAEVEAGIFSVLEDPLFPAPDVEPLGQTSGKRLQLARQLTNWESQAGALVARVRVNRIWQRLFEDGLVETASNFGVSGMKPTHPQLLEWLAGNFVDNETKLKPLLKLIMTSQTYMQRSDVDESEVAKRAEDVDPNNRLLWRQRLRRMEAEIVRDSMLVASGRLDTRRGGPPSGTVNLPDGMVVEAGYDQVNEKTMWRRSMYLLQRRNYHPSVLQAFDQPLLAEACSQRERSASVVQSLMMLNDRFVGHQASFLAERIISHAEDGAAVRDLTGRAFQIVLARSASDEEISWCTETFAEHKAAYLRSGQDDATAHRSALTRICQLLFSTSEFIYIH